MEKYTIEQLQSLVNSTVSILKFDESESYDGTITNLIKSEEGDYLTLLQHEEEKFYIQDIEEIYIHADGNLPIFYSPLDNYEKDIYSYPPDFFEGFYDYLGAHFKIYGLFEDGYEYEGVLKGIDPESLTLLIGKKEIDLWRINIIYTIDEMGEKKYFSVEDLSVSYTEPLDNLYSQEDFEMLVGRKIRIKTSDPDIVDEIVTVEGFVFDESITGDEICQLELLEFPDHLLEPGEIHFIYLIGEDGSETLVEPSGGSIYSAEQSEDSIFDENEDKEQKLNYIDQFINDVDPLMYPLEDGDVYHVGHFIFKENEFKELGLAIKQWYEEGCNPDFVRNLSDGISIYDFRTKKDWTTRFSDFMEMQERPYSNYPSIVIENTKMTSENYVVFNLLEVDRLAEQYKLGLDNYNLMAGLSYEELSLLRADTLDEIKSSIRNLRLFLEKYPKHIIALNSIGNSLFLLGKNEEALNYLEKTLQIYPTWLIALTNKVNVLIALNKLHEALLTVEYAQNLEPEHGEWEWHKARIYERMEKKEEAILHASESLKRGFEAAREMLSGLNKS